MAITVNYENLRTTAKEFRQEKTTIADRVADVKKKMIDLEAGTSTEVLPELRAKFEAFQNGPLVNCTNLVEKFAAHLEKVAELYEKEDKTQKENVSQVGNQAAFKGN